MLITTEEYFTHPGYEPDLELRQDQERLLQFFRAHIGSQIILWVKEGFGKYIHYEIDTGEFCQLTGIVRSVTKDHLILDPWFRHKDFGELGKLALQANDVDGLTRLAEIDYETQMSALCQYGLVIPLNQIVMAGLKQGF